MGERKTVVDLMRWLAVAAVATLLAIGVGLVIRHNPPLTIDAVVVPPCVTGRSRYTTVEGCLVHPGATVEASGAYIYCICPQDEGRVEVRR